jgi:hypothetical protein
MEYSSLITSLSATAAQLRESRVSEIDFQQLGVDLNAAVTAMQSLMTPAENARRLIQLFKNDLLRKTRAVARLTGRTTSLLERQINDREVSLTELISLKHDIDNEFDAIFSRKLSEPTGAAGGGERILEFKI